VSAERKPKMAKFVVNSVAAGRDLSISEMDLLGRESAVLFSDIQTEKGGKR
jgi:hypothetical protein